MVEDWGIEPTPDTVISRDNRFIRPACTPVLSSKTGAAGDSNSPRRTLLRRPGLPFHSRDLADRSRTCPCAKLTVSYVNLFPQRHSLVAALCASRRNAKQFRECHVRIAIHILCDVSRPLSPVLRVQLSDLLNRHLRRIAAVFSAHQLYLILQCRPALVVIPKNYVAVLVGSDLAGEGVIVQGFNITRIVIPVRNRTFNKEPFRLRNRPRELPIL